MICGLFSSNHGKPKITSEDPKSVIQSFSKSFLLSILAWIHVKWVICPAWFRVPVTLLPYCHHSIFIFSFYLISTNGYLLSPPFYIYLFYQNDLIHMPFFSSYTAFHLSHSLVHSLQNFLFNKHSLKVCIHSL